MEQDSGGWGQKFKLLTGLGKRDWPYLWGGIALAVFNTLILILNGRPWGVTTPITFISAAAGTSFGINPEEWAYFIGNIRYERFQETWLVEYNLFILAGFFIGVVISSIYAGEFRWKKIKSLKQVLLAIIGGFLMGYGARLASGCNIGALLGGTSSLSLHGWIFGIFSFIGTFLGVKIFLKAYRG